MKDKGDVYKVTNIKYDADGEDISDLPTEMEIFVPEAFTEHEGEWSEYLSDTISECSGFCHKGFSATKIKEWDSEKGLVD